jgi:hypothetical protein
MFKKTLIIFILISVFSFTVSYADDDFLKLNIKNSFEPIKLYDSQTGEYLGCLNCSKFDFNSIYNPYGPYGNKFSEKSIGNKFSEYGSPYSFKSPWNRYGFFPPVIKDGFKTKIGYLSVNPYLELPTLNPKRLKKDEFINDFVFDIDDEEELFPDE